MTNKEKDDKIDELLGTLRRFKRECENPVKDYCYIGAIKADLFKQLDNIK